MSIKKSDKVTKVLHVVGGMSAGGLEALIMNIYRNIDRSKFQFDFAVQVEEKCFYDDEIIKMGGKIIVHPKPKNGLEKYKKALGKTLENYGEYDVVHSHVLFFSGIALEVAKKHNVPIRIAHSHNTSDSKKNTFYREIYRAMMRRKIISNATSMIGCSREACEYTFGRAQYKKNKAKHFPNAIEINKYKNFEFKGEDLKSELGIEKDSILIGHIGRFSRQKNHSFLLDIFSKYVENERKAHLVLVGEGSELENIKNKITENNLENCVHLLGIRKDIPNVLNSLDLFLFPSLYEGLGIVIVEAQAAGIPCLISENIPQEADIDIGLVNRLSYEKDDKKKWVHEVINLVEKNKRNWSQIEPALKKSGYDIEESVERLTKIYTGKY